MIDFLTITPEALAELVKFANEVRDMMDLQQKYFATRDRNVLHDCKKAEQYLRGRIIDINMAARDRAEELKACIRS